MAQVKNVAQGAWVSVIDARPVSAAKLRVAAYARVSSDSDDQINSYIAQVDFYTKYIASKEEWEMVDVYADEGLTGMETQHREEFNRMIADCRDGKIDRILVKSISRFARNQEDYIYYMRELMRLGVTIRFEKENIDTGKMTSEQAADIYGAFAQMETTGHSQNMRVSNRIRMEKGIFIPAKAPFSELLVCGECGSPYRRQTYMPRGEKYHVWRCLNRMENGTKVCKHSPTFRERDLQNAVLAAINEMFSQRKAKEVARESVAAALAEGAPTLSLPAIEAQLRAVQKRQMELMRLAYDAGAENTEFDKELQKIYAAKAQLLMLKSEAEQTSQDTTEYDERMEQLNDAMELDSGAIEEYDEVMVRQLISNIKVIDNDAILVRFKDGAEIEQRMVKA